ncbi:MAG: Flp pilus assembly protein CpaB [Comamonas sp.]
MNLTKILAALLLVLAIGLGFGAWMLSRQPARQVAATSAQTAPQPATPTESHAVVVAAKAVAAGQRLAAEDVKLAQLPAAVPTSFANTQDVVGRTTTVALAVDAPVFEPQLLSGLALQVEPGQRAVSIAVKEAMAAGNHVRPGDFVDVFFTLDGKNEQAEVDTQTRLLLARSRVLAYGAASVENPPPTAAQRQAAQEQDNVTRRGSASRDTGGRPEAANTAVLAVPLTDVERLTLAEKYGQLTLALRHPDDTSVPDASLFAALPPALQPVAGRLKKGETLQDADRAYAGLRFKHLATGADSKNARRPAPAPAAPYTQASAPARAPQPVRANTVEMYQGAAVQTVSY